MTITENPPEVQESAEPAATARGPERRPAPVPVGLAGWVMTVDHKRIGRLYVAVSLVVVGAALVIGGLLALERVDVTPAPDPPLDAVGQLLSLYRYGPGVRRRAAAAAGPGHRHRPAAGGRLPHRLPAGRGRCRSGAGCSARAS